MRTSDLVLRHFDALRTFLRVLVGLFRHVGAGRRNAVFLVFVHQGLFGLAPEEVNGLLLDSVEVGVVLEPRDLLRPVSFLVDPGSSHVFLERKL